ncbi:MAG: ATP-binding protein [Methanobrevibacter sp.]|jgi:Holliday junction resolvase-like predicted endonuclease|nr:ATP-binding protein [Methanobrevibacter sp.]
MKNLSLGTQDFQTLRERDYIYVDKTKYIFEMINDGRINFLSRPRRFGKSLLLNTIEKLYDGNKNLFEDLYVYDKWDWNKTHPVVKIDFGKGEYNSLAQLNDSLNDFLDGISENFDVKLKRRTLTARFGELIEKIYKKSNKRVVVLIDEYDMPISDNFSNISILNEVQKVLKNFYNVLKTCDAFIEFIFITGISKFANTSIFSTLNSTIDLTIDDKFSCLCGYTIQELEKHFKDHILNLGNKLNLNYEETLDKIKYWYDGYSWDGENRVYAPYSCLELFYFKEFNNYWFKTGTPKYLIDFLRNNGDYSEVLDPIFIKNSRLDPFTYEKIDPIAIFFETGYLTIVEKKIINDVIHYKLQTPNFEIESSMLDHLINLSFTLKKDENIKNKLITYLKNEDNKNFQKEIKGFLTKIPSRIHINQEFYYQSIYIAWLNALGFKVEGESQTNIGSMDMILEKKDYIIIVECKFSKMKEKRNEPIKPYKTMLTEAINQIKNKKYYEKYPNKKIIMVALSFAGKEVFTRIEKIDHVKSEEVLRKS